MKTIKAAVLIASAVLAASCAKISPATLAPAPEVQGEAMLFSIGRSSMSKATQNLQNTGHYNFGVWAYKNTSEVKPVMEHYLVGYMDAESHRGYSNANPAAWSYHKMGYTQYAYTGTEGYYQNDPEGGQTFPASAAYMSTRDEQWLKYWDFSSDFTEFFAYAPYLNGARTPAFSNTEKTLTFGSDFIQAGYDNRSLYEYMYAYTKQTKSNYNTVVNLAFRRMNTRVNIRFWEDIEGYDVEVIDLQGTSTLAAGASPATGVQATPAVRTGDGSPANPYAYSNSTTFWTKASAVVTFPSSCVLTGTYQDGNNIEFRRPSETKIADQKVLATYSPTSYYAIPQGDANQSGLTFHISYVLTAQDTGETITVNNATVHVPADKVQWKANYHYTYTFKITTGSSGTTDGAPVQDYTSPAPGDPALFPIIFDSCTVEEWIVADSDHNIG